MFRGYSRPANCRSQGGLPCALTRTAGAHVVPRTPPKLPAGRATTPSRAPAQASCHWQGQSARPAEWHAASAAPVSVFEARRPGHTKVVAAQAETIE